MSSPVFFTPCCRGDFFATDRGTVAVKNAVFYRRQARWALERAWPAAVSALRMEMRYWAQMAVREARDYRRSRA